MGPAVVWTFWEGEESEAVSDALASWRRYLPEWDIRCLDMESFLALELPHRRLPSTFDRLTPTTQSDVVRLSLLCGLGGLWMDASVILKSNLDWTGLSDRDFFAFRIRSRLYVESWFLWVARPNNPHVCRWRDELNSILEFYPDFSAAPQYNVPARVKDPNYFMVYQAYLYLVETVPAFAAWNKSQQTKNASPHFFLLHPRLIKLTRKTRPLYMKRRAISAWVAGGLGAVVLALLCVWAGIYWDGGLHYWHGGLQRSGPRSHLIK